MASLNGSKIGHRDDQIRAASERDVEGGDLDCPPPPPYEDTKGVDSSPKSPLPADSPAAQRQRKAAYYCKRFAAFIFSTIGTVCVMIGYTILGGFIFSRLESPYELHTKSEVRAALLWHVDALWNLTESLNILHPGNWSAAAALILDNYTQEVYSATKNKGWDGKDTEETVDIQWSFAGALLFSITVVTTIGYGHIAPKTKWGMIATMVYALVGIPLTLLTITNIGRFMATAFRFIYKNIFCVLCCICCRRTPLPLIDSSADLRQEGDDHWSETLDRNGLSENESFADNRINAKTTEADSPHLPPPGKASFVGRPMVVNWRTNLRLWTTDEKVIDSVQVPISVTMLLIAGYIGLGALLFGLWEGWEPLEAAYFCFVTLSTIGFGDYVPGTDFEKPGSQMKLVFCALYLLLGLAFLAMCFDLMQEGAKHNFRMIGRKMGLINEEEKEEESP